MAVDPRLGYDPAINAPNSAGAQTVEQWTADVALSMLLEFTNATGGTTSPLMSAALWAQAGIPLPDQNLIGISAKNPDNALPPTLYQSFLAMAQWLSKNPQVAQQNGLALPPPTTSAAPISSEDQSRIAQATQNAADRQNSIDVANISAGASNYSADVQKQIADANRAEQARQFGITSAETAREFDLTQAQDRQQFNATLLSNLLNTATQWAKNPVDWVAHQFYMENMGVPLTAVNYLAAANVVGAVPPSGPSNVGPVVGGPAVIDGDNQLATALQVQARVVSVQEAITANPGTGGAFPQASWTTAVAVPQVAQQVGGIQQLDSYLDTQRTHSLPPEVQQSPAFQEWQQNYQARGGNIPTPVTTSLPTWPSSGATVTAGQRNPAGAQPSAPTVPRPISTATPQPPQIPAPISTTAQNNQPTGTAASGIYTGATATAPAGQPGTGAQTPQGDAMLQQLADSTGIPIDTLRQVVPAGMLAGGYSAATIAASPVVQSIINQTALPGYRTAPAGNSKFGQIQAFGIPLGNYRGGQDLNAENYLTASPSDQGQIQGTIEATGAYWPDELKRMLNTSAASNYGTGAFGKRVF